MANIIDKFLDSMKLYDDSEEEEEETLGEEEVEEEEEIEEEPEKKSFFSRFSKKPQEQEEDEEEEMEEEKPARSARYSAAPAASNRRSNVVAMRSGRGTAQMEVSMIRPSSMEDARDICDRLLTGRAVVINLEGANVELAQRIIDFTSGAVYSVEGNLQKISSSIFMCTPSNVELSGEFQNMLGAASSFR